MKYLLLNYLYLVTHQQYISKHYLSNYGLFYCNFASIDGFMLWDYFSKCTVYEYLVSYNKALPKGIVN